jgi:heme/copper-type cytochrome/quinol oxidase subunit 2
VAGELRRRLVVLIMTTLFLVLALMASGFQAPATRVIRVSAERFAYTPSEIVVEKGTIIEFHLTSDDTDHGFRIVDTDVNVQIPKRRRGETVVKYVADTAGTFVIECSRPCGAGHTAMRAVLIVK